VTDVSDQQANVIALATALPQLLASPPAASEAASVLPQSVDDSSELWPRFIMTPARHLVPGEEQ
jgi:hypothetical protein